MGVRQVGLGPVFVAVGRMKSSQYLAIKKPALSARIFHWGVAGNDVLKHPDWDGVELEWHGVSRLEWFIAVGRKPLAGKVDVVLR